MNPETLATLARIDQGELEAHQELERLRALWSREDAATIANRALIVAAHEQGARDRASLRESLMAVREFRAKPPGGEE